MRVRSYSWGNSDISWSVVMEELLHALEKKGNIIDFIGTNGYSGMTRWDSKKGIESEIRSLNYLKTNAYDLDITYTLPANFYKRFETTSKVKAAIYAYESSIMPSSWSTEYKYVDLVLPPSQYCKDMFIRNGCPEEKLFVLPHGVDTGIFNPSIPSLKIKTDKRIKFLCVGEPHYRKQIDKLIELYFKTFTNKDDVCLVVKTKLFLNPQSLKEKKGFEQNLIPLIMDLQKRYGSSAPEIKVINKRLDNIASLYKACDAFVLMTASEGWGIPYLEALAMGMQVIAPRHGGQLQFLNDENSILTKCGERQARTQEQYWKSSKGAVVGAPDEQVFADHMRSLYEKMLSNKSEDLIKLTNRSLAGIETAKNLSWLNIASQLETIVKEIK